jgi:SPP1 family predicted phage head-tail adaptor|nr:MAG TPA: head tail joining protein [Caudoviricetes sp.]
MDFSKLRHRVIFLKPIDKKLNSMHEIIPVWIPFRPDIQNTLNAKLAEVYITEDNKGNAVIKTVGDQIYAHQLDVKEYAVWASVAPTTGREYEEAQKIREETTYKVVTRYYSDITTDMKILYGLRIFDIISVLNTDERDVELQIVAKEKDRNGKG